MPVTIAIQDANIMIDLIRLGLFDHCLALDLQFMTTDIILDELYAEQIDIIGPHINSGKFSIVATSVEAMVIIQDMSATYSRVSPQDCSAIYLAQEQKGILLSGDSHLRTAAEKIGIQCFGILWVLDQLVENDKLPKEKACESIQLLMKINKRLPADACAKRMKSWCT